MMDAKYLAEIRARLDAGRIPMKSDMEALLAEVERLTKENQGLRANSEVQESIISGGRNPADKEQIVRLTMDNAAKDQQIATLEKKIKELRGYMHHFGDECARLAERQAQEQEGKK